MRNISPGSGSQWLPICALLFPIMALLAAATAGAPRTDPPLVQELMLTAAARERMQKEYQALVAGAQLTPRQALEFRRYLGDLDARIATRCREVLQHYPAVDQTRLPCEAQLPIAVLPTEPTDEQTPEEAVAALDGALLDELGAFDEMLLTEQQKVASRTPRSGGGMSGSNGSRSGNGGVGETGGEAAAGSEGGDGTQGGTTAPAEAQGEGTDVAASSAGARGAGKGGGNGGQGGAVPKDIPDGRDDDVVARQLREAAMKEQDPALRRKLWDEYKRYKAGTR